MKPIKICFLAPHVYPLLLGAKEGFGGAEIDIYNLAKGLSKDNNFEVLMVCVTNDLKKPRSFQDILIIPIAPHKFAKKERGHWLRDVYRLRDVFRIFQILWKVEADIYFTALASLESIICFFASRIKRKKFIFRIFHDWETNYLDLENKIFLQNKSWAKKLFPKLFILSLKYSDLIVVAKESEKKH